MPVGVKGIRLKKKIHSIVAVIFYLLCGGCGDPGYQLRPIGWQAASDGKWVKQFGDFEIQTRGIRGLIGESSVDPDFRIYNSTKPITVEGGELRTATEKFSAEVYDRNAIPPSRSGYHIAVKWRFEQNRAAYKVLGDHCEINLNLKIGRESRQIKIEYER